ncbi:hypothetical protein ATKI12_4925 [Kitasatospora sp. Ki12]|uniref:hypothetical protein n=1 Tax=Kitasatospora xanthocidica TaxID=83382 RepID=UPI0016767A4B|nr:hypothetical protein [Kitasatospora xanthocidica]GHF66554.1 hypothetical protein GCM10018790_50670 [Kitasatospora xanthocidica]
MKVGRSWLVAVSLLVLLAGGGLLLWDRSRDPVADRRSVAHLPLGECRGVLDDVRFSEALSSASPVTVRTTFTPATGSAPAYLSCTASGDGRRSLVVTAIGAATEAERIHNEGQQVAKDFLPFPDGEAGERSAVVRFSCTTGATPDGADRTWYYTASVELRTPEGSSTPAPGRQKTAELSVAFARQAIDKALGCTNTVQLPSGTVTFT